VIVCQVLFSHYDDEVSHGKPDLIDSWHNIVKDRSGRAFVTHRLCKKDKRCLFFHMCGVIGHHVCGCVCVCLIYTLYVDDGGHWGRGGLFTHIDPLTSLPRQQYTLAGKMKGFSQKSTFTQSLSLITSACISGPFTA